MMMIFWTWRLYMKDIAANKFWETPPDNHSVHPCFDCPALTDKRFKAAFGVAQCYRLGKPGNPLDISSKRCKRLQRKGLWSAWAYFLKMPLFLLTDGFGSDDRGASRSDDARKGGANQSLSQHNDTKPGQ